MRRPLLLPTVLLYLLLGACDGPTAPRDDVRVSTLPAMLVIENQSPVEPVFTMLVPEHLAPLIDWIPCVLPECGMIAPEETRYLPFAGIAEARTGEDLLVYHWRRRYVRPDSVAPGPITMQRVRVGGALLE